MTQKAAAKKTSKTTAKVTKKSGKKLTAMLVSIIIVVVLVVLGFVFKDHLINLAAKIQDKKSYQQFVVDVKAKKIANVVIRKNVLTACYKAKKGCYVSQIPKQQFNDLLPLLLKYKVTVAGAAPAMTTLALLQAWWPLLAIYLLTVVIILGLLITLVLAAKKQ